VKQWRSEYEAAHGTQMTRRPYTTEELRHFLERIRSLKEADLPRTKLKALYPALFEGRLQAQFEALRIRGRLISTLRHRSDAAAQTLRGWLADPDFPFRRESSGQLTTDLSEIVELYDFVHSLPAGHASTAGAVPVAAATGEERE